MLWGIILILVVLIIANIIAYQVYYRCKIAAIKSAVHLYLNSILALNVSHLHDAANFFNLQKNSSQDLLNIVDKNFAAIEQIQNINNISRGASYHFRSVFDELKKSIAIFSDLDLYDLTNNELDILYRKEVIDIKDLLELELFQISNFKRLTISDTTRDSHALIVGNFQLLSKCLLNLIENALKYCDGDIKLELTSLANTWQVKIKSFGKPLPDEVIATLMGSQNRNRNSFVSDSALGHGLSSLIGIMQFHQAKIDVLSAENGNIITLSFKKHSIDRATVVEENILKSAPKFGKMIVIFVAVVIFLSSLFTCQRHKVLDYVHLITQQNTIDSISYQPFIQRRFDEIISENVPLADGDFVDYAQPQLIRNILINYFNVRLALQDLKPTLYSWKSAAILSSQALSEGRYLFAIYSYADTLRLFFETKLYLNKELVLLDIMEHYSPEQLIKVLMNYYQPKALAPVILPVTMPLGACCSKDKSNFQNKSIVSNKQSVIDMMIDAKTKDLGLELDL